MQDAKVTPSQDGMLAFVTPLKPLLPGASYSVFVRGVRSQQAEQIAFFAAGFKPHCWDLLRHRSEAKQQEATFARSYNSRRNSSNAEASAEHEDDDVFEINDLARKGHWRTARALTAEVRERFKHEHERWLATREEAPAELKSRVRALRSGSC